MQEDGRALYFSRAVVPWARDAYMQLAPGTLPARVPDIYRRHIGIYAYRVSLLREFVQWGASPLENIEALEQLRILWKGRQMHVADAAHAAPGGVDTPEDLARVRRHFGVDA